MIAAAGTADELQRLGDNNAALADKLKKANGSKITKAFKERRAAIGKADVEPVAEEPKAEAAPAAEADTKADDVQTIKAALKDKPGQFEQRAIPPANEAPTAEDVKNVVALMISVEGLGLAAAMAVLGKHGDAPKLSLLKPEKYKAVYDAARELLLKQAGADTDPLA